MSASTSRSCIATATSRCCAPSCRSRSSRRRSAVARGDQPRRCCAAWSCSCSSAMRRGRRGRLDQLRVVVERAVVDEHGAVERGARPPAAAATRPGRRRVGVHVAVRRRRPGSGHPPPRPGASAAPRRAACAARRTARSGPPGRAASAAGSRGTRPAREERAARPARRAPPGATPAATPATNSATRSGDARSIARRRGGEARRSARRSRPPCQARRNASSSGGRAEDVDAGTAIDAAIAPTRTRSAVVLEPATVREAHQQRDQRDGPRVSRRPRSARGRRVEVEQHRSDEEPEAGGDHPLAAEMVRPAAPGDQPQAANVRRAPVEERAEARWRIGERAAGRPRREEHATVSAHSTARTAARPPREHPSPLYSAGAVQTTPAAINCSQISACRRPRPRASRPSRS